MGRRHFGVFKFSGWKFWSKSSQITNALPSSRFTLKNTINISSNLPCALKEVWFDIKNWFIYNFMIFIEMNLALKDFCCFFIFITLLIPSFCSLFSTSHDENFLWKPFADYESPMLKKLIRTVESPKKNDHCPEKSHRMSHSKILRVHPDRGRKCFL